MEQHEKQSSMDSFMNDWMKSAGDFWQNMMQMNNEPADSFFQTGRGAKKTDSDKTESRKKGDGTFHRKQKTWESGFKTLRMLMTTLSTPESLNAMLKGMDTLPEFAMNASRQFWDSGFELNKKFTERAAKMGQETKAYSFEDIDHELFQKMRDIYENEFQKYFNIPALGLNRYKQEKFNHFLDRFNLYSSALNELLYLFYVPMEKSYAVLQEDIEKSMEEGQLDEDPKFYYNKWIKILEGHYMTLLKSPEYTDVMTRMIGALNEYKHAKEDVLCDFLADFPIPTHKEMDSLYKEFHQLKKKVRELSGTVEQLENGGQV